MLKNREVAIIEFKEEVFKRYDNGICILREHPDFILSEVFVDYYKTLNNTVIQIEKKEYDVLFGTAECYKAINFYNKQPILIPVPIELIKKVNK